MPVLSDLRILYHLTLKPVRGENHQERLESFYAGQADRYDDFRKRLLPGREEMFRSVGLKPGETWVDLGAGTGSNLERVADTVPSLGSVELVDLSRSLLKVADRRISDHGWSNVRTREADVCNFVPSEGEVDVVTFSYSLTMIPDWIGALEQAKSILKPGGRVGVVDFYVARKFPEEGLARHSWFKRNFWPTWFSNDNVFLNSDHLPMLRRNFEQVSLDENDGTVPYLPALRVPYYRFIGKFPG